VLTIAWCMSGDGSIPGTKVGNSDLVCDSEQGRLGREWSLRGRSPDWPSVTSLDGWLEL
jgi:hypothetical protein